jgi:hypothetical protein
VRPGSNFTGLCLNNGFRKGDKAVELTDPGETGLFVVRRQPPLAFGDHDVKTARPPDLLFPDARAARQARA